MELRHLRYFVAVAEELHFGRAAERLHIAQPPLSRQIKDLEREIEAELFERLPRGVELTAAGRAFLPQARLTLAQAERATRSAQRAARGEVGRLRVGFIDFAAYAGALPEVLSFFRMHLPRIGLSLFEMDSAEQEEALREGRIDVGIMESPPADADRWLHVEEVYSESLVAALPKAHRRAAAGRLNLRDFASDPFVMLPRAQDVVLYDETIARCRAAGFSPQVVQEAGTWQTAYGLVGAGVGIAFVPRSLSQLRRPGVVFRPVRGLALQLRIYAAWKTTLRSPVRERFVTTLRAIARADSQPARRLARRAGG